MCPPVKRQVKSDAVRVGGVDPCPCHPPDVLDWDRTREPNVTWADRRFPIRTGDLYCGLKLSAFDLSASLNQRCGFDLERLRNFLKHRHGGVSYSPLDARNVSAMDTGAISQFFLAYLLRFSRASHIRANALANVHGCMTLAMSPFDLQPMSLKSASGDQKSPGRPETDSSPSYRRCPHQAASAGPLSGPRGAASTPSHLPC